MYLLSLFTIDIGILTFKTDGPNLFIKNALSLKEVSLFGEGEELRDHIDISLVSELIKEIICFFDLKLTVIFFSGF